MDQISWASQHLGPTARNNKLPSWTHPESVKYRTTENSETCSNISWHEGQIIREEASLSKTPNPKRTLSHIEFALVQILARQVL